MIVLTIIQAKAVSCVSLTVAQQPLLDALDQQKTATLIALESSFHGGNYPPVYVLNGAIFCSYPLLVARAAFYQRRDHCFHAG